MITWEFSGKRNKYFVITEKSLPNNGNVSSSKITQSFIFSPTEFKNQHKNQRFALD